MKPLKVENSFNPIIPLFKEKDQIRLQEQKAIVAAHCNAEMPAICLRQNNCRQLVVHYEEEEDQSVFLAPKNVLLGIVMTFFWWEIESKGHPNEDVCVYFEELQLKQYGNGN